MSYSDKERARWPLAIDPAGCGCTECLIGMYVPADQATAAQVADLVNGRLANNLGEELELTVQAVTRTSRLPGSRVTWLYKTATEARLGDLTWDLRGFRFDTL